MASATLNFLPLSATIISTDTGGPVQFELTNTSTQTLRLYWIDRSGTEQLYSTVAPGQSFKQGTYGGHAWEVKSDDGSIGFKFFPSISGSITVSGAGTPAFIDYSEKVSHSLLGDWSTAQGYGLINAAKSLGIADIGEDLPLNAQSNNVALNAMHASSAWAAGFTGKGVKVAVIDAGIGSHAEVNGSIAGGYDFHERDDNPAPDNGSYGDHALGVAAIIASSHSVNKGQDTKGVAPNAQLLNVRVGSSQGSSSNNMALGIRYAVDQGAKVICMPLQNSSPALDQQVADAVHYAYSKNVVTVIIGGNFSSYGPTGPALIAKLSGEAIAVGNFNALAAAPFESSNQPGATPFPWVMASSSGYVPNGQGGYTYWNDGGTSFAGPYVAGLAALLVQQNPDASAKDIMERIIKGASISQSEATEALGAKVVSGSKQGDSLQSSAANETIDGAAGVDVVQFQGAREEYLVSKSAGSVAVIDRSGRDGSDILVNAERIKFSDQMVALDVEGNAGQVYRLYQAAFNRTPDKVGLGFWISMIDNGLSLDAIAREFVASDEFKTLYGAAPSTEVLINAIYQNVLHRAPDKGGFDFWLDVMSNHGVTPSVLVTEFSESAENKAALATVIGNGFDYVPFG